MTSRKTILVATDLSAPARHAVERAFQLTADAKSALSILYVMELDALDALREMLGGDLQAVKAALRSDACTRLEQLTRDAGTRPGTTAITSVAEGNPLAVIAAAADTQNADLVVLGARGESFLRHTLLGSTAARLLRKSARRPVLVVKQAPHERYRSVVVAVDFSAVSIQAIRLARVWAPTADLVLLHAFELPYEGKLALAGVDASVVHRYVANEAEVRRSRLHALAVTAGLTAAEYSARIVHGDPAQQIISLEQEVDADLIVVGKHGLHIVEELLLGSVTKHVLAQSQGDVLVVCAPQETPQGSP